MEDGHSLGFQTPFDLRKEEGLVESMVKHIREFKIEGIVGEGVAVHISMDYQRRIWFCLSL